MRTELIAELNRWNTSAMAIYLATSLSGCAQAVLSELDASLRRNYKALSDALSLRFGNGGKIQVFRSQLKSCVRGKDESHPELAQAIQRLVRQAYPEAHLSVWEVLAKEHLLMQFQIQIFAGKYFKLDPERYRKPSPRPPKWRHFGHLNVNVLDQAD